MSIIVPIICIFITMVAFVSLWIFVAPYVLRFMIKRMQRIMKDV